MIIAISVGKGDSEKAVDTTNLIVSLVIFSLASHNFHLLISNLFKNTKIASETMNFL